MSQNSSEFCQVSMRIREVVEGIQNREDVDAALRKTRVSDVTPVDMEAAVCGLFRQSRRQLHSNAVPGWIAGQETGKKNTGRTSDIDDTTRRSSELDVVRYASQHFFSVGFELAFNVIVAGFVRLAEVRGQIE